MSERRMPLGKVSAKDKDSKERVYFGTIWPGRYEGKHDFQLGVRMKDANGEWQSYPTKVVVDGPNGEIVISRDTHFMDYFPSEEESDGGNF